MTLLLRKKETLTNMKLYFLMDVGGKLFVEFRFSRGVLEDNTREKRGMNILQLMLLR